MSGKVIGTIPCVGDCSRSEETARAIAQAAASDLEARVLSEVKAASLANRQLLLSRTLHYLAKRSALAHVGAALRDADVNDPSRELYENKPEPLSVGFLNPLVEQQIGEEVEEGPDAPTEIKFKEGFTYVFDPSDGGVTVTEYSAASGMKLSLDDELKRGSTLNGHALGVLISPHGPAEDVFVKEKAEDDGSLESVLEETVMEAGTCAALSQLGCFVAVRAVQVKKEKVWMAFERLPGRNLDELIEAMESKERWATEAEAMGVVMLVLDSYCKLA
jgi:hypothetical protein